MTKTILLQLFLHGILYQFTFSSRNSKEMTLSENDLSCIVDWYEIIMDFVSIDIDGVDILENTTKVNYLRI